MEKSEVDSGWYLPTVLTELHTNIKCKLKSSRKVFAHPGTKGDASETTWLEMLSTYLPKRYQALTAHVVDSKGVFSQQIDVVIVDRQYSPFIFDFQNQKIVPAESVYAVFEAKQDISKDRIKYAQEKISSVRRLHRTSLPIPHAGGTYPPKPLFSILGGLLALESTWSLPLGDALNNALKNIENDDQRLDLGCVASHGTFEFENGGYKFETNNKAATSFLFELIARLQTSATVPMIDVRAYANWLNI
jgi:hypothetical protein